MRADDFPVESAHDDLKMFIIKDGGIHASYISDHPLLFAQVPAYR